MIQDRVVYLEVLKPVGTRTQADVVVDIVDEQWLIVQAYTLHELPGEG